MVTPELIERLKQAQALRIRTLKVSAQGDVEVEFFPSLPVLPAQQLTEEQAKQRRLQDDLAAVDEGGA